MRRSPYSGCSKRTSCWPTGSASWVTGVFPISRPSTQTRADGVDGDVEEALRQLDGKRQRAAGRHLHGHDGPVAHRVVHQLQLLAAGRKRQPALLAAAQHLAVAQHAQIQSRFDDHPPARRNRRRRGGVGGGAAAIAADGCRRRRRRLRRGGAACRGAAEDAAPAPKAPRRGGWRGRGARRPVPRTARPGRRPPAPAESCASGRSSAAPARASRRAIPL